MSEVDSVKPQQELRSTRSRSEGMPPKKVHLSNRERLLLRKQALKMKQQPVLAVGNMSTSFIVSVCYYCGVVGCIIARFENKN